MGGAGNFVFRALRLGQTITACHREHLAGCFSFVSLACSLSREAEAFRAHFLACISRPSWGVAVKWFTHKHRLFLFAISVSLSLLFYIYLLTSKLTLTHFPAHRRQQHRARPQHHHRLCLGLQLHLLSPPAACPAPVSVPAHSLSIALARG